MKKPLICCHGCGRPRLSAWLGELNATPTERISESMLEAQAIVAIKQPVTAVELASIYGAHRREGVLCLEAMDLIERRAGAVLLKSFEHANGPSFDLRVILVFHSTMRSFRALKFLPKTTCLFVLGAKSSPQLNLSRLTSEPLQVLERLSRLRRSQ